jgi:glycosyltransferase involved in cell wall biosynthesis
VTLPFVSILIPTYARVGWLEEALYSALHQDYAGKIEILIYNDCERQRLTYEDANVRVINASSCLTLGSKRNRMLESAAGEYVVWLDDDDLALPWYVNRLIQPLAPPKTKAVISRKCYFLTDGVWHRSAVPIEMSCDRQHAISLGGFSVNHDSGEDQIFRSTLEAAGGVATIFDEPAGYVYRWGQGTYHISAKGVDIDGDCFRQEANLRMDAGAEPSGAIVLHPRLKRDWFASAPKEVRDRLAAAPLGCGVRTGRTSVPDLSY